MSDVLDALIDDANRTGRSMQEVLRQHLLEGVLRRLAASGDDGFVLRGSTIARLWVRPFPRSANDLDFLGTFDGSVAETQHRFRDIVLRDADDGIRFDDRRLLAKAIWADSAFPGVRVSLSADVCGETQSTTVDIGFRDPLVPPAEIVHYSLLAGDIVPIWAVHPATLIAWKLHGLAEWGRMGWRPKDVLDLVLLTGRFELSPVLLAEAIRVAFESRGYAATDARRTLDDPAWQEFHAAVRWREFHRQYAAAPMTESIVNALAQLRARLTPALDLL